MNRKTPKDDFSIVVLFDLKKAWHENVINKFKIPSSDSNNIAVLILLVVGLEITKDLGLCSFFVEILSIHMFKIFLYFDKICLINVLDQLFFFSGHLLILNVECTIVRIFLFAELFPRKVGLAQT